MIDGMVKTVALLSVIAIAVKVAQMLVMRLALRMAQEQWRIMVYLKDHHDASGLDIIHGANVSPGHVYVLLDDLEDRGWIRSDLMQDMRRRYRLTKPLS